MGDAPSTTNYAAQQLMGIDHQSQVTDMSNTAFRATNAQTIPQSSGLVDLQNTQAGVQMGQY